MTVHVLKLWPAHFEAVQSDARPFEIRYNDRGFAVGDEIRFQEFDPDPPLGLRFTGREFSRVISWITDAALELPNPAPAEETDTARPIRAGWVVLGLARPAIVLDGHGKNAVASSLLAALIRREQTLEVFVREDELDPIAQDGAEAGWAIVVKLEATPAKGFRAQFKRGEVQVLEVPNLPAPKVPN